MTRRSRERRAAAGDGDPAGPPHYAPDEERRLAEEVLYLHSLWRRGPPAPAPAGPPAPPAGGSRASAGGSRPNQRKRRRTERTAAEPEEPGADWPLAPSPPASPSPASWPDAAPSSPAPRPPPQQQPSPASLAQRDALRAAEEFFSARGSSGEDGDGESEGSESEDGGDAAAGFFLGLFERDAALRGYYERCHEEGEFRCMGCVGRKRKGRGQARRFRDCKSLVHHARDATRCGRPLAHRALAAAVCRVLGWDVKRLPSIVIDPCGTLGQALLAREGASAAASTAQEAKENVDSVDNDGMDAVKEDVGLDKNGSLNDDRKEDVDSRMNEAALSDGDGAKDGVDTGKIGSPSNDNDGEVHGQDNDTRTVEKEGAIGNKQEHPKSADAMGGTCDVRPENNSSKEEAATENKEEHTDGVVDSGDDIGNLGDNLVDSSKS
ncbi:hypothetical protein CFC21_107435 [Triticum aestivum]|nr:chloride intracellular channel protein 6 isoform X2 [Aegilops tauschii subsp. strangulata]XP_044442676.1 chloride intracellular channel protein 6-like isoform X2 [Triticum aestivum]KAF7106717.1 hypothetical protein CFC21_107435 [Triticum aestivum]